MTRPHDRNKTAAWLVATVAWLIATVAGPIVTVGCMANSGGRMANSDSRMAIGQQRRSRGSARKASKTVIGGCIAKNNGPLCPNTESYPSDMAVWARVKKKHNNRKGFIQPWVIWLWVVGGGGVTGMVLPDSACLPANTRIKASPKIAPISSFSQLLFICQEAFLGKQV